MSKISPTDTISLIDSFDTMRRFLEAYWERGGRTSDDIAILLGSLNRDEFTHSPPLDAAMWEDWLSAASEVVLGRPL